MNPMHSAARAQFDRQSDRYGKTHILADTRDVAAGLAGVEPPTGAAALDVATGGGHTALWLARNGWAVTAGDVAPRMLDNAKALCAEAGFSIQTRLFPAEEIPFPDDTFHLVTTRVAPHHFSSPEKFIREAARVLTPGGHLLLIDGTVPDDDSETEAWLHQVEKWRDPSHGRFLPRRDWEVLARAAGLKIIRSGFHPLKQPDLEWYFETAGTPAENREKIREAIRTIPAHVKTSLRLAEEDGKTVWWWLTLTLLAARTAEAS